MSQTNTQPSAGNQTFWIYLSYILGGFLVFLGSIIGLCGFGFSILGCCVGLIGLAAVKNNDTVRFHCAQSMGLCVAYLVLQFALFLFGLVFSLIIPGFSLITWLLSMALGVGLIVLTIIILIRHSQGRPFEVPYLSPFTRNKLVNLIK